MRTRNTFLFAAAAAALTAGAAFALPGEAPCLGDCNEDGMVAVDDLIAVIADWGTDGSDNNGDITGPGSNSPPDGIVDVNDLIAILNAWGPCP